MKFSEYLRKLDEGNLGHELEKQEAAKKKPDLKVGEHSQEVADRTMSSEEQKKMASKRSDWRAKLRPTGDDGKNTVKEPSGETMLDPVTGKPFPKTGSLKDWQIPSLREDHRQYDPNVTRENEEDEPEEDTEDDGHAPKPKNTKTAKQLGIEARMKERDAREARLSNTIAHSEAKRKANESVEIPERDALGRLSIYSMQESSTNKFQRKALKKAKMGKKLSNKESGNVMNNPNADGSTRTNAAENYKNPQDDIDAHVDAQASDRENAAGMDRQKHLDESAFKGFAKKAAGAFIPGAEVAIGAAEGASRASRIEGQKKENNRRAFKNFGTDNASAETEGEAGNRRLKNMSKAGAKGALRGATGTEEKPSHCP